MASPLDKRCPTNTEISAPANTKSRGGRTPTLRTLLCILFSLTAAFYYLYPRTTISSPSEDDTLVRVPLIAAEPFWPFKVVEPKKFEPLKRYSLNYGKVACWQDGGLWMKKLTPVEMVSLGVDRFRDTDRAPEQAEEDAFCERLRMYGPSFWALPPQWPDDIYSYRNIEFAEPAKELSFEVGFPTSGGVWFLDKGGQAWDEDTWPICLGGLRNALTMDERCEVIKELGGLFCEDPQVCPELASLVGL